MSSADAVGANAAEDLDLICELESIQGIVDALTSVRWKRYQDALVELSEHGIVIIVEETGCLQVKDYLKRELFLRYDFGSHGPPRSGLSLGLFVDCLNTFSVLGHSSVLELRNPGPDMQLLLRMQRKKGQFTSSKSMVEEPGSSAADGNGSSGQDEQDTMIGLSRERVRQVGLVALEKLKHAARKRLDAMLVHH